MRKWMIWAATVIMLVGLCGCGQQSPASGGSDSGMGQSTADAFSDYVSFGLSYDVAKNQLFFQDERVRYFEDVYPLELGGEDRAGMTWFDEGGSVDVVSQRDLTNLQRHADGSCDPSGVLLGLSACSQEVFDARDLEPLLHPVTNSAQAGEPDTPEELAALYGAYAPYGLTYDKAADALLYQGQTVRAFQDILASNGEPPETGTFRGTIRNHWTEGGTVDVDAVRDYVKTGADGYGMLIGVKARSQAEFDVMTAQEKETGGYLLHYGVPSTTMEAQASEDEAEKQPVGNAPFLRAIKAQKGTVQ